MSNNKFSIFILMIACLLFNDSYAGSNANVTKEDKKIAAEVSKTTEDSKEKTTEKSEASTQKISNETLSEENQKNASVLPQNENKNNDKSKIKNDKNVNENSDKNTKTAAVSTESPAQLAETAPISSPAEDLYAQKLSDNSNEALTEFSNFANNIKEYKEENKDDPELEKKTEAYHREKANELFVNLGGMKEDLAVVKDSKITSESPNYEIPVRLYRKNQTANKDLIIFVHGGGWTQGNLTTHDYLCRKLASILPADVVAVDYRLSPENTYPTPLNDVVSVYKHYTSGKDYERFILCGDSAGGNLCAALCIKINENKLKAPFAQILIYPILGNNFELRSYTTFKDCLALSKNSMLKFITTYSGKPVTDQELLSNKFIFPLLEENMEVFPEKNIIITAGYDILLDDQLEFAMKLRTAKKNVEHIIDKGVIHGYMSYGRFYDDLIIQNCTKIKEYLYK